MQYGRFDDERREYVVERVDTPVSWTNYIGVNDYCAVLNQTAGGYSFYRSPQYHRVTRFRPNGVPLDRPGHYVYLRDDDTGDYWSGRCPGSRWGSRSMKRNTPAGTACHTAAISARTAVSLPNRRCSSRLVIRWSCGMCG